MKSFFTLILFLLTLTVFSQDVGKRGAESMGLGVQVYPAGVIINAKSAWAVSAKGKLIGKLGYNIARRQNFGKHDSEEGGGLGFTLAYKRYFKTGFQGLFIESRMGLWFLDIDWRDNTPLRSGSTDITVLQPTIGIGYDFPIKGDRWVFGALVAFGYEVNMVTSGEPVGEGGISLAGLSIAYRLGTARSDASSRN